MSSPKDEESAGLSQLRESFPADTTDSAGMMLDDACLLRYLRARSGNVAKAAAMLQATLEWRREFDVQKVGQIYPTVAFRNPGLDLVTWKTLFFMHTTKMIKFGH